MYSESRFSGMKNLIKLNMELNSVQITTKSEYSFNMMEVKNSSLYPDKSGFRSECVISVNKL